LRSVQRWLAVLVKKGFVDRNQNRYSLSIRGKREIQFRAFARSYGSIALNNIMNCHFPTLNTLEENITKLVEIFGTYVVYCLIEAARLITADKNNEEEHWNSSYFGADYNFKDGKFREGKLVNSWIKDIFSPWHMLNLFLTAISNQSDNEKSVAGKISDDEGTLLHQYLKDYEKDNLLRPSGISVDSIINNDNKNKEKDKVPATTLDLMLKRAASIPPQCFAGGYNNEKSLDILMQNKKLYHFFKIRTAYNEGSLLYELNSEKIKELKDALGKVFPLRYKCLEKTDDFFYSKENHEK
jgi:hypothetical protein